ncbi:MAG: hypothetical protein HY397_02830 [Candidatus Doudnabacteria bacterium]|nr:hypothetical protein [Candidatus Doudnabacteria bacterium]
MTLAFHLGRVYTLSLAELYAVFALKKVTWRIKELFGEVLIAETDQSLDVASLQKRLGGIIKIIQIIDVIPLRGKLPNSLSAVTQSYFHINILKSLYLAESSNKTQFGVSIYPLDRKIRLFGLNKKIGLDIKKTMQSAGISCRLVIPEGISLALPSVAVTNNLILERGAEIDLVVSEKLVYVGKTLTVQDFADYGRRDYQRPLRDARVGMLPPKVAQVMVNLARFPPDEKRLAHSFLLDPFCGSGTILQEAMLMGYRVLGSDASEKAVAGAEQNLGWIRTRYKLSPNRFEVVVSDVADLSKNISGKTLLGVVSEGTLGPPYEKPPEGKEVEANLKKLGQTYLAAFKQFKKILQPGQKVVMALPAYRMGEQYWFLQIIDKIAKLGYDIVDPLPEKLLARYGFLKVTKRNSIIYDRKDQIVVREIIIFQQKANKIPAKS